MSENLTDGFVSALFWYVLLGLPGLTEDDVDAALTAEANGLPDATTLKLELHAGDCIALKRD